MEFENIRPLLVESIQMLERVLTALQNTGDFESSILDQVYFNISENKEIMEDMLAGKVDSTNYPDFVDGDLC